MNPGLVVGSAALGALAGALANGVAARIGPARYAEVRAEVDATGMDDGLRFVAPVQPITTSCSACGTDLASGPLLTFVGGRGSCPACGTRRRPLLLVVEVVTATAFALLAARAGVSATLVPLFVLTAALVAASLVDLAYGRLPDAITFPTLGALVALIAAIAIAREQPGSLTGAAVGAGAYFGFLLMMHLLWPRGMGFGDVKLALPMGLVLGWIGWSPDFAVLGPIVLVMDAVLIGSFLGAVGGLVIARALKTSFPLGPFLAAGTYAVLLFANELKA